MNILTKKSVDRFLFLEKRKNPPVEYERVEVPSVLIVANQIVLVC